eukprot:5260330-Pyramimonas_sp.AAC.1
MADRSPGWSVAPKLAPTMAPRACELSLSDPPSIASTSCGAREFTTIQSSEGIGNITIARINRVRGEGILPLYEPIE